MDRLTWLFPLSAVGWVLLVAAASSWPRLALTQQLPAFPSDLGGALVLTLLSGTVLGSLAIAGFRPPAEARSVARPDEPRADVHGVPSIESQSDARPTQAA